MSSHRDSPALVEAVFFDAGNTLVEMDYGLILSRLDPRSRTGVSIAAVRRAEQSIRPDLDTILSTGASTENSSTLSHYLDLVADALAVPRSPERDRAVQALVEHHHAHNLWNSRAPGVETCLDALRGRGFRLGVISNARGDIDAVLRRLDLLPYFERVFDSSVVGIEKPDPRIFLRAAGSLSLPPSCCAYVGDLHSVDVRGARAAGLHALLLDPLGAFQVTDCPRIRSLDEIPELLC